MSSPDTPEAIPKRKKKACRRCRHRKQRCDFDQPCQNCTSARVDCLPVVPESYQSYPASYVTALEDHAAVLERTLNEQQAGTTTEQFEFVGSQPLGIPQTQRSFFGFSETSTSDLVDAEFDTLLGEEGDVSWQNPQTPNLFTGSLDLAYQSDGIDHNYAQPSKDMPAMSSMPSSYLSQTEVKHPASIDPIPVSTAASFFRTYFQCIHPQYPFLSIKDCNLWYDQWKSAPADNPITGWPALFVKMIFALGSLVQAKSDTSPRYQHQDLKSQAQSEVAIIQNTKSSPLIRLQAMLLSAMHALHSDSTARITHLSGAIIRFASFHGFHRLVDLGDEESKLNVRVWSSAYALDRSVSTSLDIPVSLPDMYTSSPLYIEEPEHAMPMSWLSDVMTPLEASNSQPELGPFAHTCKIRLIQSSIMHNLHISDVMTSEWHQNMSGQIDSWSDQICTHSLINNEGYQSPLWLGLISQLSRIALCRPSRENINDPISDIALQASCEACTTFRALQKKRQVAQPWLVVLTQFQAGVTILYIMWARGTPMSKQAAIAVRDCTSVLAILADRWQNAENYRDCFEVLVQESSSQEVLESGVRRELVELIKRVDESGVHRHVTRMLYEMASAVENEDMEF